jgi:molecular chaperone DnaK
VDIDEAVFQHVVTALDGAVERLDPDEPAAMAAVARLRAECVDAKEALSSDTDVSIPVFLPDRCSCLTGRPRCA